MSGRWMKNKKEALRKFQGENIFWRVNDPRHHGMIGTSGSFLYKNAHNSLHGLNAFYECDKNREVSLSLPENTRNRVNS